MKRKVIQIANSTQLISMPRKWCIQQGIKKGDELEIEVEPDKLTIFTERKVEIERVEFNSKEFGSILTRYIHGLYKRGVDEIKITINDSSDLTRIQRSLSKDVGFEIVEQGPNYCLIKNISGDIESFDQLLRRIFMLLLNMADEGLNLIKQNKLQNLKNLIPLEDANNRFTISCRRYLNKKGHPINKVGPMYYIIEALEKLADEYKYFYKYLSSRQTSPALRKEIIAIMTLVNSSLRNFVECFYKFDPQKLVEINKVKDTLVQKWDSLAESKKVAPEQVACMHHLFSIGLRLSDFTGALIAKD